MSETITITLASAKIEDFARADAICAKLKVTDPVYALIMSPSSCDLARLEGDGQFVDDKHHTLDLAAAYEAIFFSEDWQLKAVREGLGARLELIHEGKLSLPNVYAEKRPLEVDVIPQKYLMWGKVIAAGGGWCKLGDARVGSFAVPAPEGVVIGNRLAFTAREYIHRFDHNHGNAGVVRQRLTGITVAANISQDEEVTAP